MDPYYTIIDLPNSIECMEFARILGFARHFHGMELYNYNKKSKSVLLPKKSIQFSC